MQIRVFISNSAAFSHILIDFSEFQDVWGQVWTTGDPIPAARLVLQELQVGIKRQVSEGPVADRQEGVPAAQGWDGHQDQVAKLREQRQTIRKVKETQGPRFNEK